MNTSSDGKYAQEIIESNTYDCYLVDLRMPIVDGIELYEWTKQYMPGEEDKFIFITGDSYDPRCRNFLDNIENMHIIKPFAVKNLKDIVKDFFSSRRT